MLETELPASLYKLYGAARIDVLESLCVCFSSPHQLNDPLEGISPIVNAMGEPELAWIADQYSQKNWEEKVIDNLTERFILEGKAPRIARKLAWKLSKSKEAKRLIEEFKLNAPTAVAGMINAAIASGIVDEFSETIGIFSMTECVDSGPMWAHYGQEFEGFAVEFDLKHDFFFGSKVRRFLPKPVLYESRTIDGLSSAREADFFSTKSEHWAYEREWRLLQNRDEADLLTPSGHSLFKIEPSVIDRIIIGSNMAETDVRNITGLVAKESWGIAMASPNRDKGKIEVLPLSG